jgi:hypothetical protein
MPPPGSPFELPPPANPRPNEHAIPVRSLDATLPAQPTPGVPFKGASAPPPTAPQGPASTPVDFSGLVKLGQGRQIAPAGYQPHARTTRIEEGVQFSPETKQEVLAAQEASRRGITMQTAAEREKVASEARTSDLVANQIEVDRAEDQIRRARQESQLQAEQNELDSLVREQKARPADANYWGSKTTGQRIAMGIALALGSFSSGLRGGPNVGLEILNRDVDNFVMGQRATIEKGQKDIENRRGMIGLLKEKFGDEDRAVTAGRILAKEQLQNQIQARMAGTADKLIQARGQQLLAQNAEEIAKLRGQFEQMGARKVERVEQEAYRPAQYGGGQAQLLQALQRAAKMAEAIKELKKSGIDVGNMDREAELAQQKVLKQLSAYQGGTAQTPVNENLAARMVKLPSGQTYLAHDEKGANAVRELQPKVAEYQALSRKAMQLRKELFSPGSVAGAAAATATLGPGGLMASGIAQKRAELESTSAAMDLLQKDISHLGQIAGADVRMMSELRGDVAGIGVGVQKRLENAEQYTNQLLDQAYKSQLGPRVDVSTGINEKGEGEQQLRYREDYAPPAPTPKGFKE